MLDSHLIPHIQNVRQRRHNLCGPAALAAVLNYWGVEVRQEEIAARVFRSAVGAAHGSEMLLYAINSGLRAYSYRGSLRDVKRKVAEGVPLVVLQMSSPSSPTPHYRVVVGYDDGAASILALDPAKDGLSRIGYRTFNRLWHPCGKWALLAIPEHRDGYAKTLGDKNAVFHYDLATAHLHAGDRDSAVREIAAAYAADPVSPAIGRMRGYLRYFAVPGCPLPRPRSV